MVPMGNGMGSIGTHVGLHGPMGLKGDSMGSPWGIHEEMHGLPMGFKGDCMGGPCGLHGVLHGVSMWSPLAHGRPMGPTCGPHGDPMGYSLGTHGELHGVVLQSLLSFLDKATCLCMGRGDSPPEGKGEWVCPTRLPRTILPPFFIRGLSLLPLQSQALYCRNLSRKGYLD